MGVRYPLLPPHNADPSVPEESQSLLAEALDHVPMAVFWTAMYQLAGFPLYLVMNAAGQNRYPKWTNHFMPSSVIFRKHHKWQIIWSDIGLALVIGALTYWAKVRSFQEMFLVYGIPYLLVNSWIVMITYLQHTDPTIREFPPAASAASCLAFWLAAFLHSWLLSLRSILWQVALTPAHYSDKLWTFPRGALCTIDRTFLGPIGAYAVHGLCETHVLHHVCSKIPHYHAWEATEALKAFIGEHYQRSEENMLVSLWKSHRQCMVSTRASAVSAEGRGAGRRQSAVISCLSPVRFPSGLAFACA